MMELQRTQEYQSGTQQTSEIPEIKKLSFEKFRNMALDVPASLEPGYREADYSIHKAMESPYARGLFGWPLKNNFMYQIIDTIKLKRDTEDIKKISEFIAQINSEGSIHNQLKKDWADWCDEFSKYTE